MKKKHLQEIERINKSIPQHLLDALIEKKPAFPTIKEIATRAIDDPNVSEEDKRKFRTMLASGYLDKTIEIANASIEQQIDAYLEEEFAKARKLGRLPPPQRWPLLKNKSKKLYGKHISEQGGTVEKQEDTGN